MGNICNTSKAKEETLEYFNPKTGNFDRHIKTDMRLGSLDSENTLLGSFIESEATAPSMKLGDLSCQNYSR